ncbi:MAG TPA: glutamine--fructose-6-phosphate transaminase (isomerizing), partial [Gammaproteobacteria bacterium]|nr:glutamine--fructose-6-phosphate transaminase (isomerizing) [Gammaproteobacteria bacterium]
MCGIVGAVAQRDVLGSLVEGLKRLEYRGYDSAGAVVLDAKGKLARARAVGKVAELEQQLATKSLLGHTGIAHTRWATHGAPSEANAHPHICRGTVAVVHNGIIENHEELRAQQIKAGYEFTSQTDTEVVVHQIHHHLQSGDNVFDAVRATTAELLGAYALGVISVTDPNRLVAARRGSPLVIGLGEGENFIASDVAALLPVTRRFIILEDGDIADITKDTVRVINSAGQQVDRKVHISNLTADAVERGEYRHYMLKEIFEQSRAVADTLEGRIFEGRVLEESFGPGAAKIFDEIQGVHIIACGTSYHAGMIARYWLESLAGIPCSVEV